MKINFSVLSKELSAMRLLISKDESRMVLCGVHLEVTSKKILLIAMDGRRMGILKSECAGPDDVAEKVCFTIPDSALERIWERNDHSGRLWPDKNSELFISYDTDSKRAGIALCTSLNIECAAIDAQYPKWRQVLPTGTPEPMTIFGLNTELIADFGSIHDRLKGGLSGITFRTFGLTSPIEINLPGVDNFYGLLMLMKSDQEPKQWSWLKEEQPKGETQPA